MRLKAEREYGAKHHWYQDLQPQPKVSVGTFVAAPVPAASTVSGVSRM